jgi:surface-anchored protein
MKAKTHILITIVCFWLCEVTQALIPITSHIDVEFDYLGNGEWREQLYGGGTSNDDRAEGAISSDTAFIVVPDIDWQPGPSNQGARFIRPSSAAWNFTGAEAGAPLWILTQSDNSIAWPGIENNHGESLVASYSSDDPRVSSLARPWIVLRLSDVHYLGRGQGHFALWQSGFGSNTVWASTTEGGITRDDAFFSLENGHDHANWGFSDLGLYVIDLYAEAYLGPGKTNLTQSEVMPVIFAVGSYAIWQATSFKLGDLLNPDISGDYADPDKDGLVNLVEYALNTSPAIADRSPMEPSTGAQGSPAVFVDNNRLTIEFVRRRSETNPQIRYRAVFSDSLKPENVWKESGTTSISPIDSSWERIKVVDSISLNSANARFARVEIEWAERN